MRRILLIIMLLFSAYLSLPAQNFLDFYRNGTVTQSIPVADVDQLRVSKPTSSGRNVNIYRDGRLWLTYDISNVDSIKVYRPTEEQLVYLGIVGFNQDLYIQPFGILAQNTADTFSIFVNNLNYRDGTILYYAVDNALDMLSNFKFNTSLSSVNLITFTDGLDQGSLMMNSNFTTENAYLNALSGRILSMKVAGHPLTAYSLGMRGNDVSDKTMFATNLRKLASSADKATEVSSIYDVESQLQEIADQIISVNTRKSISVRIPGPATGTTVRFVFDGKNPESSSLYIEGVFNMNDMSLTKIRYQGIKASSGSVVKGTRDGIFVTFKFTDLQLADGSGLLDTSYIRQYNKASGSTTWQVNSEFSPDSNVQTSVTYSGCAIMLVLDCSRSLGSDFSRMQGYVVDFINKIARNTADFEVLAPTDLTAKLNYSGSKLGVELSWLASKHADSYIVYRSKSASGSYTKIAENITSTRWNDPSPLSGMNYYKVVAVSAGLQSPESNVASVNYAVEQPENLSAKLAERNGKLVVDLTWSASQNAQSYLVYRSSSASGTYTKVGSSTTNTWTDYHASSGMNYYKVEALGYGLGSGMTSYVSVNYKLSPPENLRASLSETEGVVLSWEASLGAQSYTIYRSTSSSGTYKVVAEGVTSTRWADPSPLSGTAYYKVEAVGRDMVSEKTSYASVSFSIATPAGLSAAFVENKGIVVSWTASKYAQYYKIYRSSSTSGTYSLVADSISSTSWTDPSPLSGKNYYKVAASGYGITSYRSSETSVNFTLAVPTDLTASMTEQEGKPVVSLSWTASQYAQSYTVYRSENSSGTYSVVAENVTSNSWTDLSPLSGMNYYKVAASGYGINSNQSSYASVSFTIAAPTGLSAAFEENKGIVVSWTASQYAQSYTVYRSSSSSGTYRYSVVAENVTSTSWTDSSPLSGNNYYKVEASGYGLTSSQSSPTSLNLTLAAPTDLSANMIERNGKLVVDLSWTASQYAQSYTVYRSSSSSRTYRVLAENITSTSWTDSSPLSGYNYYKVAASGYGLTGSQSSPTSLNFTLAAPTFLSASMTERNGKLVVDLSWRASQYAQSYTVYRSSSSSGTYSVVAENVTSTSWTDSSPLSGNNYYKVEASGYGLTSSQSSPTSLNFTLAAPTDLSVNMIERNGKLVVDLSWTASQYAQSYTVYRLEDSSGTYSVVAENITSTSWTDSSPLSGNNFYKVVSVGYGLASDSAFASIITSPETFTVKGVQFTMMPVEGGTFQMGSETGDSDEKPVHEVKLNGFSIGQTEVTQELWEAVMGTNPSYWKGLKLPVEKVSWDNCQTFITKLNSLTGQQFRLPTEAEWEYAARGGNQSKGYTYSGSNNLEDVAWYTSNSGSETHNVGTKSPNELGIYDMSGNVWEWCQDWVDSYSSSSQTNPAGPSSGSRRVIRGGSWRSSVGGCRVAYRSYCWPDSRYDDLGLRLAL